MRSSYHLTEPIEPHLIDGNALFLDSGFTKSDTAGKFGEGLAR